MLLAEVIQGFLDLYERPRYLEVGVHSGDTFHALRAAEKTAVDPAFRFDVATAAATDSSARYHPVTSDAFFLQHCPAAARFDVVFLDGLHTFEQTLRDLMNTLARVHDRSVIVIDDVRPNGFAAALPDLAQFDRLYAAVPGTDPAWMGDVYRLVAFIDAFMPLWSYATVAENHGQLVMWRQARAQAGADLSVAAVASLGYADTVLAPEMFRLAPYADILQAVRAWLGDASGV